MNHPPMFRRATLLLSIALALCAAAAGAAPRSSDRLVTERLGLRHFTVQRVVRSMSGGAAVIALELDGRPVHLRLAPSRLRAPGFRVLAQASDGAFHEVAAPAPETWRGTIDELPGARVGGSIHGARLSLTIGLADGRCVFVQPLSDADPEADPTQHVVYLDDPAAASGLCGTSEPSIVLPPPAPRSQAATGLLTADLALDCDFELYALEGHSVDATVQDMENVIEGVNIVYNRDCNIQHQLVRVLVRSAEPDPYTSTSPDTLLTQFRNEWNAHQTGIARDVAHLMTGKDLNNTVVGYSAVGVVCNVSRAYGVSQTRFSTNLSRRVALTAHELGHEWNASHCDGTSPCNIMCSSLGGCDGIGLPNFEPMGMNAIRSFAATRSCLSSAGGVAPPPVVDHVHFAAGPTPSNGDTQLSYVLDDPQAVRLEIFDLSGQRVAKVFESVEAAGEHAHVWTGIDRNGRKARPGHYEARLVAGPIERSAPVILIE